MQEDQSPRAHRVVMPTSLAIYSDPWAALAFCSQARNDVPLNVLGQNSVVEHD